MSRGSPENSQGNQRSAAGVPETTAPAQVTGPDATVAKESGSDAIASRVTPAGMSANDASRAEARVTAPVQARLGVRQTPSPYAETAYRPIVAGLDLTPPPLPPREVVPHQKERPRPAGTPAGPPRADLQDAWRRRGTEESVNQGRSSRGPQSRRPSDASRPAEAEPSGAGGGAGGGRRPPVDGGGGGFDDGSRRHDGDPQGPEEEGDQYWIHGTIPPPQGDADSSRPYRIGHPSHPERTDHEGDKQPAPGSGGRGGGGERGHRVFEQKEPGEPGRIGRAKRRVADAVHSVTDRVFRRSHPILLTSDQVEGKKTNVEDLKLKYENPRFADRPVVRNLIGGSLTLGSIAGLTGATELQGVSAVAFTAGGIWAVRRLRHTNRLMVENVSTVVIELGSYIAGDIATFATHIPDGRLALFAALGAGIHNLRKGRKISREKGQFGAGKTAIGSNAALRERLTDNIIGGGIRRTKREITDAEGKTRKIWQHVEDRGSLRNEVDDRQIAMYSAGRKIEGILAQRGRPVSFWQNRRLKAMYRLALTDYNHQKKRIDQKNREIRRWEELQPEIFDPAQGDSIDPRTIYEEPRYIVSSNDDEFL